jgi:hypothetical protein
MSPEERRCYLEVFRNRYRRARKKDKGAILDDLCGRFEVSRKWGIQLLTSREVGRPRKPGKRGRPARYVGVDFIRALRLVWRMTRYMCGRYLACALPDWLPFIEAERGAFAPETRALLLSVSGATIDRVLKPFKAAKGKSFTRSGGFRDQIPIQPSVWDVKIPGYMEADTVAHCGGSMAGEFVYSLTLVDIATIWTEVRSVFGRGESGVFDQLLAIEADLPFEIRGYDADNGGEVLNKHIYGYFVEERKKKGLKPVQVTRSREYRKNDNAYVEQRNDSLPRQYLGYDRMGFPQIVPLLNYYWAEVVCPLRNHFYPALKLKDKVRIKSRMRRVYDKPVTPYRRVIESEHVPDERKQALMEIHRQLNPVALVRQEALLFARIDTALKKLRAGEDVSALLAVPASRVACRLKATGTAG